MNQQIESLVSVLEFIEEHLCDPVTVADMAAEAGYSLFHFIRVFNKVVRHTPYDYLLRRRLSHAAWLLLSSDWRILEIAVECQFGSHEAFTRAFTRLFGVTPSNWRECAIDDFRRRMPPLSQADLLYRTSLSASPEIVHLPEICLSGWMQIDALGDGVGNDLRRYFNPHLKRITSQDDNVQMWSLTILPELQNQPTVRFVGIRVKEDRPIPMQFVIKRVSHRRFLGLELDQARHNWKEARTYLYQTFMPKAGLFSAAPLELVQWGDIPRILVPI